MSLSKSKKDVVDRLLAPVDIGTARCNAVWRQSEVDAWDRMVACLGSSACVARALTVSYNAHKGQLRKSFKDRSLVSHYIMHPLRVAHGVAKLGFDDDAICVALLHDVIEDTFIGHCRAWGNETSAAGVIEYLFNENVKEGVLTLTAPRIDDRALRKKAFRDVLVSSSRYVKTTKAIDRIDNLSDIAHAPFQIRDRYVRESVFLRAALDGANPSALHELDALIDVFMGAPSDLDSSPSQDSLANCENSYTASGTFPVKRVSDRDGAQFIGVDVSDIYDSSSSASGQAMLVLLFPDEYLAVKNSARTDFRIHKDIIGKPFPVTVINKADGGVGLSIEDPWLENWFLSNGLPSPFAKCGLPVMHG